MDILKSIDHTVLKATAGASDIKNLCAEAKQYAFASVCVNSVWVKTAAELLHKPNAQNCYVAVCAVVGFPLGAAAPQVKAAETAFAVLAGAHEIDMVIDIGAAKDGRWDAVEADIAAVVQAARDAEKKAGRGQNKAAVYPADRPVLVKVILENCYLTKDEIVFACKCAVKAGADFVKTSTGFGTPSKDGEGRLIAAGALEEDVALMRKTVGPNIGVKASGGIRDLVSARAMIAAGANRLGCSAGVQIAQELDG